MVQRDVTFLNVKMSVFVFFYLLVVCYDDYSYDYDYSYYFGAFLFYFSVNIVQLLQSHLTMSAPVFDDCK